MNLVNRCLWAAGLAWMAAHSSMAKPAPESDYVVAGTLDVAEVLSEFRVGFSLLTTPARQYVAYYDPKRRMTVASRPLDREQWTYQTLPSKIGWDSHNYITMAVDSDGHLHVTGNLHADPLIYFRTEKPGDISSLKAAPMVGKLENRMTYPKFLTDHNGRLIFMYRHGGSGNGIRIFNRYDPATQSWSRLYDKPLFDGEGKRNAYPNGPTRGPDGWFHVHWVWRHSPDCATNHQLSYMRSRDMVHWESAFGDPVNLPIRIDQKSLIVDPIPSGGGIINGGHRMVFDANQRPILAYHKSDEQGNMQIYLARPHEGKWQRKVITQWEHPVPFSGNGSMGFIGIRIQDFRLLAPDVLAISFRHKDYGNGTIQVDAQSFGSVEQPLSVTPELPRSLSHVASDFPGMEIQRAHDLAIGAANAANGVRYLLQWETLGPNRDRPRKPPLPEPSTLRLYKLIKATPQN